MYQTHMYLCYSSPAVVRIVPEGHEVTIARNEKEAAYQQLDKQVERDDLQDVPEGAWNMVS